MALVVARQMRSSVPALPEVAVLTVPDLQTPTTSSIRPFRSSAYVCVARKCGHTIILRGCLSGFRHLTAMAWLRQR